MIEQLLGQIALSDEEVWLQIFCAKIQNNNVGTRSGGEHADEGLSAFRKRFPKEEKK